MKYALIFGIDWFSSNGEKLAHSLDAGIQMKNEYVKMFATKANMRDYVNIFLGGFTYYYPTKVVDLYPETKSSS